MAVTRKLVKGKKYKKNFTSRKRKFRKTKTNNKKMKKKTSKIKVGGRRQPRINLGLRQIKDIGTMTPSGFTPRMPTDPLPKIRQRSNKNIKMIKEQIKEAERLNNINNLDAELERLKSQGEGKSTEAERIKKNVNSAKNDQVKTSIRRAFSNKDLSPKFVNKMHKLLSRKDIDKLYNKPPDEVKKAVENKRILKEKLNSIRDFQKALSEGAFKSDEKQAKVARQVINSTKKDVVEMVLKNDDLSANIINEITQLLSDKDYDNLYKIRPGENFRDKIIRHLAREGKLNKLLVEGKREKKPETQKARLKAAAESAEVDQEAAKVKQVATEAEVAKTPQKEASVEESKAAEAEKVATGVEESEIKAAENTEVDQEANLNKSYSSYASLRRLNEDIYAKISATDTSQRNNNSSFPETRIINEKKNYANLGLGLYANLPVTERIYDIPSRFRGLTNKSQPKLEFNKNTKNLKLKVKNLKLKVLEEIITKARKERKGKFVKLIKNKLKKAETQKARLKAAAESAEVDQEAAKGKFVKLIKKKLKKAGLTEIHNSEV